MAAMDKAIRYGPHYAKRMVYAVARGLARRLSKRNDRADGVVLYPLQTEGSGWIFHDEKWVRVIHRWEHRRVLQQGRSLTVFDNTQASGKELRWENPETLSVDVPASRADRWIYLYLNPTEHLWRDFRWEFVVSLDSDFQELQFGFRYIDFYNRYRIRYEGGYFCYDVVLNGAFYNNFGRRYFPMELAREYHITLYVRGRRFVLMVGDKVILDEFDFANHFPRGSVAIILWEIKHTPPIRAKLRNMKIVEIHSLNEGLAGSQLDDN